MQVPSHRIQFVSRILVAGLLLGALGACRKGSDSVSFVAVSLPSFGTNGCNSPNNTFAGPTLAYTNAIAIGAMSQMAASLTDELIYVTGADGSVLELDFTGDPLSPTVTTVVASGLIDALLAAVFSPAPPAVLSGIAVLDPSNLVVIEHASNTVLIVNRFNPTPVGFFAGFPSQTPSLVDGPAGAARFGFGATPVQIVASGDGRLFVVDGGNDVIREVQLGGLNRVRRVAGIGVPASLDGQLGFAGFDGPTGLSIDCAGQLVVSEGGADGNRLRLVRFGPDSFFGTITGTISTLAGDGSLVSAAGAGTSAALADPVSPVTTAEGEVYWMDAETGILRRYVYATGLVDCPMFADCTAANTAGGSFSGKGNYSMVITKSGRLYVMDGMAGEIRLVSP